MILRFIKEIKSEDAERLRNAAYKIEKIQETVDSFNYLWYSSENTKNKEKNNYYSAKDIFCKKIAPHTRQNKYQLLAPTTTAQDYALSGLTRDGKISEGSNLRVSTRPDEDGNMLYWITINEPPEHSPQDFEMVINDKKTNLSVPATYFFNRKDIYIGLKNAIIENKEKFISFSGEKFTNNLISLFSANYKEMEIPDFHFAHKNFDKELLISGQNYDYAKWNFKDIGVYYVYYSNNQDAEMIRNFRLSINNKNKLGIYLNINENPFYKGLSAISDKNLFRITENPFFEKIVNENLQEWLKDVIRMKDFALTFYKNIETSILREIL